jgi:regulatory protein SWI5
MREQSEMRQAQASMATAPMPTSAQFDSAPIPSADFMNMSNLKLEFMKYGPGYESSQVSPSMSNLSPEMSDYSSPAMPTGQHFGNPFQSKPILEHAGPSTPSPESETDEGSPSPSSNRRSMTIDGIDLQETITDTGITLEEISMYIGDPDPVDQKWTCLFPECGKRFGRKENIKSHVQTHLGDRQYQCPHCHKCFVRQHDLKRHAKIHSGVKPYPCMCGNSFARHDALTRHRQRGMCIGAFEGIVKKVVKRGRPRKPRPDGDERREKKTRMRSKNKSISSGSSCSGASDSSGLSPPADLDAYLSTDYQDTPITSQGSFNYASASSPAPIDYVSPAAIQTAASPSAFSIHTPSESHYSFHSHASPPPMSSPERNSSSRHNTPPPLCLSSSSPAPSQNYLCDIPEADITPLDFSKFDQNMGMGDSQDCLFVDSFNDMGATRLEQDPSLLLLGGKFDDAFGDWDNWGMMAQ